MRLNEAKPDVPLRPILEQDPMPAVATSYGVSLFQMHLGIALAAGISRCGSCDVCGGCVEFCAGGLEGGGGVGFARHGDLGDEDCGR